MNRATIEHWKSYAIAILATAALGGCGADAQDEPPATDAFTVLHSDEYVGSGNFTHKQTAVLTTQEDYQSGLARYTSEPPASVDFGGSSVLLLDMGERPTGGYSIQLDTVDIQSNRTIAEVTLTHPGDNCVVTEAITNPYQFVEIPVNHEILIRENLLIDQCHN